MQHLEDGYLHAIADGEVPSDELVAVRDHLDACEECRARLDEARLEAETARELIELIEVPVESAGRLAGSSERGGPAMPGPRQAGNRWVRPLAWAATVAMAAGIGYYGRGSAPFAVPAADPLSIGRIDTVFLDVPASPAEPAASPLSERPAAARQNATGARAEDEQAFRRRSSSDTMPLKPDETVVTGAAPAPPARRAESDAARDQLAQPVQRAVQPSAPSVAMESRLMAKSALDEAPTVVSFPRAVELLGGRIKLIEGMVPSRLEAVGRTVRVIYVIDEGNLVLSQAAAPDSLHWNLAGPLSADSLAALRERVR